MTYDGDLSQFLTHRRYEVEKEYLVEVAGTLTAVASGRRSGERSSSTTKTARESRCGSSTLAVTADRWLLVRPRGGNIGAPPPRGID